MFGRPFFGLLPDVIPLAKLPTEEHEGIGYEKLIALYWVVQVNAHSNNWQVSNELHKPCDLPAVVRSFGYLFFVEVCLEPKGDQLVAVDHHEVTVFDSSSSAVLLQKALDVVGVATMDILGPLAVLVVAVIVHPTVDIAKHRYLEAGLEFVVDLVQQVSKLLLRKVCCYCRIAFQHTLDCNAVFACERLLIQGMGSRSH